MVIERRGMALKRWFLRRWWWFLSVFWNEWNESERLGGGDGSESKRFGGGGGSEW